MTIKNLSTLRNECWTPELALRTVLDDVVNIEEVVIVTKMKDGTYRTEQSWLDSAQLAALCSVLQYRVHRSWEPTE